MSSATTIPTTPKALQILDRLTRLTGKSAADAVEAALNAFFRSEYIRLGNEGYSALQADPDAWNQHVAERTEWDATLFDGLDSDEVWEPDGRCVVQPPVENT